MEAVPTVKALLADVNKIFDGLGMPQTDNATAQKIETIFAFVETTSKYPIPTGREVLAKMAETDMLGKPLRKDAKHLLELKPGWADMEGDDNIDDRTFATCSTILLILYLMDFMPEHLVACPQQTIDFKFDCGTRTMIVGETDKIIIFDGKTKQESVFVLNLISSWLTQGLGAKPGSTPRELVSAVMIFLAAEAPREALSKHKLTTKQ